MNRKTKVTRVVMQKGCCEVRIGDMEIEQVMAHQKASVSSNRKWLCSMHCTKTLYAIFAIVLPTLSMLHCKLV